MSNPHDIEWLVEQRRREVDDELARGLLLRQLDRSTPAPRRVAGPALRVRFGLMLIRVGSRLAAC